MVLEEKESKSGKRKFFPSSEPLISRREDLLRSLGQKVRALRSRQRWSQQILAKNANLSPRFIAQLESGKGNISIAKLDDVAQALGVSLNSLLQFEVMDSSPEENLVGRLRSEVSAMLDGRNSSELMAVRSLLVEGVSSGSRSPSKIIALLGLMGSGKSTIGPQVAAQLRRDYVELEDLVASSYGLSVSEIYELHGESRLRQLEFEALRDLVESGRTVVVSLSGGAITHPEILYMLQACTLPVWLKARPEELFVRVLAETDRWKKADKEAALNSIRTLYKDREPLFERSRIIIDTTAKTEDTCVRQLVREIKSLN